MNTCETCKFSAGIYNREGHCHRYPKALPIWINHFCGEHQPIPKAPAPTRKKKEAP